MGRLTLLRASGPKGELAFLLLFAKKVSKYLHAAARMTIQRLGTLW